jgi:ornithine cyclodeaminase/alanine dehydrogenase-like protein (mu-crystallin family)
MNELSSTTRRTFLVATLAAPAILRAQDAPARLKVAFIGVGNRGSYLLTQMLKLPDIDIVAICDLIPERTAKAAAEARAAGHNPAEYEGRTLKPWSPPFPSIRTCGSLSASWKPASTSIARSRWACRRRSAPLR